MGGRGGGLSCKTEGVAEAPHEGVLSAAQMEPRRETMLPVGPPTFRPTTAIWQLDLTGGVGGGECVGGCEQPSAEYADADVICTLTEVTTHTHT